MVACEIVQQMINHLATHTPNTNCSQDSLQNHEEKDQSLVKTSSVMSTAAAPQNLVSNQFIMADQDVPLDLSVKKIKVENIEQGAKQRFSAAKWKRLFFVCY